MYSCFPFNWFDAVIYDERFWQFLFFSKESVPSGENQNVAGGDEEVSDEYQDLNAREEQDIEIMMEGCEYAISNAEAFADKLSRELQVLDGVWISCEN